MKLGKEIPKKDFNKWIKALRSEEYLQTIGHLQNEDSYCCLGVACAVLDFTKELDDYGNISGTDPADQEYSPEWLKNINNRFYLVAGESLVDMNDSFDHTFNEIADMLELVYVHGAFEEEQ